MLRHGALSFLEGGQKVARGAQVAFLFERSKRRIGTPQSCLQHRIGIEDNGETHLRESLAAWIPPKTMLATCGTLIDLVIWVSSSRFSGASTKVTSAPASTKLWARSIASERPLTALASVRAMIWRSPSCRVSTAALIFCTISSVEIMALPAKWPQRLGKT